MSQLSKSDVINLVTAVLNASPEVYGPSIVPLFTPGEIDDAIDAADQAVLGVVLDTPGHRSRSQYIALKNITDGAVITDIFEGGVLIDGRPGVPASPGVISTKKRNTVSTISNITKNGYYCIQGHVFSFVGSTAQIEYINYATGVGTLASPPEYVHAVVAGALSILFPKDGTNIEAADHFSKQYIGMLTMIKDSAVSLPAVTPFHGAKQ